MTVAHGYQTKKIKTAVQKLVGRRNAQPVNAIASSLMLDQNLVNNVLYGMFKRGEIARTRNLDIENVSQYTYYLESSSETTFKQVIEEWQNRRSAAVVLLQIGQKLTELAQTNDVLREKDVMRLMDLTQVLLDMSKSLLVEAQQTTTNIGISQ